jgi:hypothetical protein
MLLVIRPMPRTPGVFVKSKDAIASVKIIPLLLDRILEEDSQVLRATINGYFRWTSAY